MRHVGVDGCRAGWVAVYRGRGLQYAVVADFGALMQAFPQAQRIYIDIPIGLPFEGCPTRPCDGLARRLLGRIRSSSVFSPPCREALQAKSIAEARRINLRVTGKSLAAQTWNISAKIREVDSFLLAHPEDRKRVREIHPELCFRAFNGGVTMANGKATAEGLRERVEALRRLDPGVPELLNRMLLETRRSDVQRDDLLDAAAAFFAAESGAVERLCGMPAVDAKGLAMEILYPQTA